MVEFRLHIGAERYRIREGQGPIEGEEPVPVRELRRALLGFFSDDGPLAEARLGRLCNALWLEPPRPDWSVSERDQLIERMLKRFETRAALVREPWPEYRREHVTEEIDPSEFSSEELEWIEIQLVDQDDKPVPNVAYRIELTDKRVRTGVTNMNGVIRYDRIPGGTCKFSFTKLDKDIWKPA